MTCPTPFGTYTCWGHGDCISNVCQCNSNWNSRGDFIDTSADCNTNNTIILIFFILQLCLAFCLLPLAIYRTSDTLFRITSTNVQRIYKSPIFISHFLSIFLAMFYIIFDFIHLLTPQRISYDPDITIFWNLAQQTTVLIGYQALRMLMPLFSTVFGVFHHSDPITKFIESKFFSWNFYRSFFVIAIPFFFVPVIGLNWRDRHAKENITIIYHFGWLVLGCGGLFFALQIFYILKELKRHASKNVLTVSEKPKLQLAITRLKKYFTMMISMCAPNIPIVLCFLFIPSLLSLVPYFFPIHTLNQILFGIFTCLWFKLDPEIFDELERTRGSNTEKEQQPLQFPTPEGTPTPKEDHQHRQRQRQLRPQRSEMVSPQESERSTPQSSPSGTMEIFVDTTPTGRILTASPIVKSSSWDTEGSNPPEDESPKVGVVSLSSSLHSTENSGEKMDGPISGDSIPLVEFHVQTDGPVQTLTPTLTQTDDSSIP